MQCYSEPRRNLHYRGHSFYAGQQVSRAQQARSPHRLRLPPRVSPRESVLRTIMRTQPGGQPALGPPCRSPPPGDLPGPPALPPNAPAGAASGVQTQRRDPPPQPPSALGLTPFSPTSKTGYLVHALQTTLWTFSLLFKSPPGEGGKKKKNPEEIRVNWKEKKFKRVSTAAKKGSAPGLPRDRHIWLPLAGSVPPLCLGPPVLEFN